jgi:hypothetical protein
MSSPIDKYLRWDAASRKYLLNEERRYILPYDLYFDLSDVSGAYVLPAAPTEPRLVSWKQQYSSANGLDANLGTPLEIKDLLISSSTGYTNIDYLIELSEIGESRKFMNRPIHVRTIFGDAQYPGKMCEPYMFASQHQIQARFVTMAGFISKTARAYLSGAQYYPWAAQSDESRRKITDVIKRWNNRRPQVWPFWLTTDQDATVAAGETRSFEMLPGQDAHFVACSLRAVSVGVNFEYELMEVKTGQVLSNGFVRQDGSIGDARFPMDLPVNYVIPAGYRLRLNVRSSTGGTLFFVIAGKKVYAPLVDVPELAECENILEIK